MVEEEVPMKFNPGIQGFEPDLEKIKERQEELEDGRED